ncbi:hypothetical protein HDE_04768 [Halotydeus destructor]|nr:hypothetical protein HDE_04768 [Halotydeus destructor]
MLNHENIDLCKVNAYDDWDALSSDFSEQFKRQVVPMARYGRASVIPAPRVGRGGMVAPRVGRGGLVAPRVGRGGMVAPRVGRGGLVAPRVGRAFYDYELFKRQGIIPGPRVGRTVGVIPSPRVGRSFPNYRDMMHFDFNSMKHDGDNDNDDDDYSSASSSNNNASHNVQRRKRSILEANDDEGIMTPSGENISKDIRDWLMNGMSEHVLVPSSTFRRTVRQIIPSPRVGRRSDRQPFDLNKFLGSYFTVASNEDEGTDSSDPIDLQLRAVYIPRFGKRAPGGHLKRAAFTPRIGRAVSFTPRLGRSSWDLGEPEDELFYEQRPLRGSFTPRIGRSVDKEAKMDTV